MKLSALLASAALAGGVAACDAPPDDPGSVSGGATAHGPGGGSSAADAAGGGAVADTSSGTTGEADAVGAGGGSSAVDAATGAADDGDGTAAEDAGPVEPEQPTTTPLDSENLWNAKTVCPPEGPFGVEPGEIMRNLHLKNCMTGEKLDLHDLCGAQAFWIFTVAGWCPQCGDIALSMKDQLDPQLVEDGARIIVAVHQTFQRKPATAEFCMGYAKIYQIPLDRVIMAYDPTAEVATVNKKGAEPFHMLLDRDLRAVLLYATGGETASTPLVYLKSIMKEQKKKDAKAAAEANP